MGGFYYSGICSDGRDDRLRNCLRVQGQGEKKVCFIF